MYSGLFNDPSFEQVKNELEKNFHTLGFGDFGVCFVNDDSFVIKLHRVSDAAYLAYVTFCLRVRSEYKDEEWIKHFPRIKSFAQNGDHIIVMMERLYEHSITQITHPYNDQAVIDSLTTKPYTVATVALEEARLRFLAQTAKKNPTYSCYKGMYQHAEVIGTLDQAFEVLVNQVYKNNYVCDLNASNILFRDTEGKLDAVITDPFNSGL